MNRQVIIEEIRRRLDFVCQMTGSEESKSCLAAAVLTCQVLSEHGQRAVLQAGSMSWPLVTPEQDDGVGATHFSYVWEPDSEETKRRIASRLFPEIHCWAALPDVGGGTIIDVTTRHFQERAKHLNLTWRAAPPPDVLWTDVDHWPRDVVYHPSLSATRFATGRSKKVVAGNDSSLLELCRLARHLSGSTVVVIGREV